MIPALVTVLLAILVLLAWLGTAGFVRLHTPLARLHAAGFVVAGCSVALLGAALLADGASARTGKIAVILVLGLLANAAASHAIGRALRTRGSAPEAN